MFPQYTFIKLSNIAVEIINRYKYNNYVLLGVSLLHHVVFLIFLDEICAVGIESSSFSTSGNGPKFALGSGVGGVSVRGLPIMIV